MRKNWLTIYSLLITVLLCFIGCGKATENTISTEETQRVETTMAETFPPETLPPETLSPETEPTVDESKKKTLMIYMIGSDLESSSAAATNDMQEILQSRVDCDRVRVLIYTGGSTKWHSDVPNDANAIYLLTNDGFQLMDAYEDRSMGDEENLSFFLYYAYNNYPSVEYSLILWDHGNGPVMGYGTDRLHENDALTLPEMKAALLSSPFCGENRLAFIGFDACLMASAELALTVADHADYLIASEETEPNFGWNYSFLSRMAEVSGEELGKLIVDDYMEYCRDYGQKHTFFESEATLAVMDLRKIAPLESAVDALFQAAIKDVSRDFRSLIRARIAGRDMGKASTGSDYDLVDLWTLADAMKDSYPRQAETILEILSECIVYHQSNTMGCMGLSLFYPFYNKNYYDYRWREDYKKLGLFFGYQAYLERYEKVWLGTSSDNFFTGALKPEQSGEHEYNLVLQPEQLEHFAKAGYYILQRTGSDLYRMIYYSEQVTEDEGVLTAAFDGKVLSIQDRFGRSEIIPAVVTDSLDPITYYATDLMFRNEADLSAAKDLASAECVFLVDHETGEVRVLSIMRKGVSGESLPENEPEEVEETKEPEQEEIIEAETEESKTEETEINEIKETELEETEESTSMESEPENPEETLGSTSKAPEVAEEPEPEEAKGSESEESASKDPGEQEPEETTSEEFKEIESKAPEETEEPETEEPEETIPEEISGGKRDLIDPKDWNILMVPKNGEYHLTRNEHDAVSAFDTWEKANAPTFIDLPTKDGIEFLYAPLYEEEGYEYYLLFDIMDIQGNHVGSELLPIAVAAAPQEEPQEMEPIEAAISEESGTTLLWEEDGLRLRLFYERSSKSIDLFFENELEYGIGIKLEDFFINGSAQALSSVRVNLEPGEELSGWTETLQSLWEKEQKDILQTMEFTLTLVRRENAQTIWYKKQFLLTFPEPEDAENPDETPDEPATPTKTYLPFMDAWADQQVLTSGKQYAITLLGMGAVSEDELAFDFVFENKSKKYRSFFVSGMSVNGCFVEFDPQIVSLYPGKYTYLTLAVPRERMEEAGVLGIRSIVLMVQANSLKQKMVEGETWHSSDISWLPIRLEEASELEQTITYGTLLQQIGSVSILLLGGEQTMYPSADGMGKYCWKLLVMNESDFNIMMDLVDVSLDGESPQAGLYRNPVISSGKIGAHTIRYLDLYYIFDNDNPKCDIIDFVMAIRSYNGDDTIVASNMRYTLCAETPSEETSEDDPQKEEDNEKER